MLVGGGLIVAPTAAFAADSDVVSIPDANLKAAINSRVGAGRTPDQDVTVADAQKVTQIVPSNIKGPISDLTGLEALTNLTTFQTSATAKGNSYSDLTPLAGLAKLTALTLTNGEIADLAPLHSMSQLKSLVLTGNKVADVSPLSGLTGLTTLNLASNQISDVSSLTDLSSLTILTLSTNQIKDVGGIPAAPNLATLQLANNKIKDVGPLAEKLDTAAGTLATLNLSGNRITDPSPLVTLGESGGKLGNGSLAPGTGLLLGTNRIADFSAFSVWAKNRPTASNAAGQSIYLGAYHEGGVTVSLKTADATAPSVSSAAGSYDPATGKLTVTDPAAESVAVAPSWTVFFSNPPVDPGDESGPVIVGTPQVGEQLSVSDYGSVFADGSCAKLTTQWLRDGEIITSVPHFTDLNGAIRDDEHRMGGSGSTDSTGTSSLYTASVTDLGHQVQARSTCAATGVSSTSAPVAIGAAQSELPLAQALDSDTDYNVSDSDGKVTAQAGSRSGVIGDPTNPTIPVYLAQLDASGKPVNPADIQFGLSKINGLSADSPTDDLTADDVHVTGSGAQRTITIDPRTRTQGVRIFFTVTGTTGKTSTLSIVYKVSVATTPTSRVLLGSSDASTAIDVGDGYLMVGDDENLPVRLYNPEKSGREVAAFTIGDNPSFSGTDEMDTESSARKGDTIWWLGSHGNSKAGEVQLSRHAIFATKLTGSGADAKLTPTGVRYGNLRNDLIDWDVNHGDRFGFKAATAKDMRPDPVDGFNIEGSEFSPDGSELYLGFRSPLVPKVAGGKALIVPLTNLEDLTSGEASRATFGDPILLDLGGDSIREIRKNSHNEYLILSAPGGALNSASPAPVQTLWAWDGDPATAPQRLTTTLPVDVEPDHSDNIGAWEGIGTMPERLAPGADVRLIMDQGYDQLYDGQGENKDDGNDNTNKARTDIVKLAGPAGTVATVSDPGAFPDQLVNTLGAPRTVTVTNAGSNVLHVGDVFTEDEDGASADDFLLSTDTCSNKDVAVGKSCTVRVRFAPSRSATDSAASLVIESDVAGGRSTVALTGTSLGGTLQSATPTITGTAVVGETLTAVPGDWAADTTFAYQWIRDGDPIDGATKSTYHLAAADAGKKIAVDVTGSKDGYSPVTTHSLALTVQPSTPEPGMPTITGTAVVGETLTAVPGDWADGTEFAFQWLRDGDPIGGATEATYDLVAADAGKQVAVKVTGTLDGAEPATATSVAFTVQPGTLKAGTPTISGTPTVGKTLTAAPGSWPQGTAFAYQWTRGGAPIQGATGATYTLAADDAESDVAVVVTGTLDGYNPATATSKAVTVALAALKSATPTITGTHTVGKALTAVPGDWTEGTAFAYQWTRGGTPIQGATKAGYTLAAADGGTKVAVEVTGTKAGFTTVTKKSDPVTIAAGGDGPGDGGPGGNPDVPAAPSSDDLNAAPQNGVKVGTIGADGKVTVTVPTAKPGEELTSYVYSDPQLLGTSKLGADHTVVVTLPKGLEAGTHRLAVLDADGNIVGWAPFKIAAAPGGGTPGGDAPGGSTPGGNTPGGDTPGGNAPGGTPGGGAPAGNDGGTHGLPRTGAEATPVVIAGGLLLLGGAGFLLLAARRRRATR